MLVSPIMPSAIGVGLSLDALHRRGAAAVFDDSDRPDDRTIDIDGFTDAGIFMLLRMGTGRADTICKKWKGQECE